MRPATSLLLALAIAVVGCSSSDPPGGTDGEGGTGGKISTGGRSGAGNTGGKGGGTGGAGDSGGSGGGNATGGSGSGSGGSNGSGGGAGNGSGGSSADASGETDAPADTAGGMTEDSATPPSGDGPPALPRPDAMGQPCKSASNEAFTVSAFEPQTGVFTAWFSVTPSTAPTNSVIGLSDGDVGPGSGNTPLHELHQILIRFAMAGTLDARNGTAYQANSVIMYKAIQYDFRLVVDVPNKTYSAYVSWAGQPEITIGTNFKYRETAKVPTKFDHWAVQSVASKTTACNFIVRAN
jgi:hypothetical protein